MQCCITLSLSENISKDYFFNFTVDILNGVRQTPKRKSVQVRILVEESNTNGIPKLYVEEEFIAVEGVDVEQVNVHQVIWESNIRKPLTIVQLVKSKIHAQPREQDHSMFIKGFNFDNY